MDVDQRDVGPCKHPRPLISLYYVWCRLCGAVKLDMAGYASLEKWRYPANHKKAKK